MHLPGDGNHDCFSNTTLPPSGTGVITGAGGSRSVDCWLGQLDSVPCLTSDATETSLPTPALTPRLSLLSAQKVAFTLRQIKGNSTKSYRSIERATGPSRFLLQPSGRVNWRGCASEEHRCLHRQPHGMPVPIDERASVFQPTHLIAICKRDTCHMASRLCGGGRSSSKCHRQNSGRHSWQSCPCPVTVHRFF